MTGILPVPERVLAAERRRESRQLLARSWLGVCPDGYGVWCWGRFEIRRQRHDWCRRRDCLCGCHPLTGMLEEQADWEADQ